MMGIFFAASAKRIRGEKLIEEEKAAVGGVEWAVYYGYAKSIGIIFTICSISFYGIYQVTTITYKKIAYEVTKPNNLIYR